MSETALQIGSSASGREAGRNRTIDSALRGWLFESPRYQFAVVLFAVSLLKTGVWYFPSIEAMRQLAVNPFANPFSGPGGDYLIWNWLGPFLAWSLGATSKPAFILFHLLFSLAFTGLFLWLSFTRLPDREARVAVALFFMLPVSATAYFWVGMDSITLFLMLAAFVFPRRGAWAFCIGLLLGMQHFEQGAVAAGSLLSAVLLQLLLRQPASVSPVFCGLLLLGIIAGASSVTQ